MKKIILLIISVTLISCTHAQKKYSNIDTTKIAYGNFLLKIPTNLLPNAVLIAGSSGEDNYLEGVGIKFSDRQALWGGVFIQEPTVAQVGECTNTESDVDLKLALEKINQELNGHRLQKQYMDLIKSSSCQIPQGTSSVSTDITPQFIIASRCENLECSTYVVEKNNANNSQILMLFTKGLTWSWIKKVIKGA
ncbi:hypothetical protein [Kangiella spongicola]|uniref:Lipoprotein n=1 Tax=Kangiella spongicola TaxID=796379 RepID=A0A318DB25_9GAMM|nr:hypothetical protein [Kangiella spongicola]PXF64414.1 hypothetical protein DL796_04550 [Kangiella spongicola]